jgi:sulfite exporter TauE/SafE
LSIGLGVLMLLAAFSVINFEKQLIQIPFLDKGFKQVRFHLGRLLAQKSQKKQTLFLVGVLDGFLPCGLVYLAVVGAIGTGSILGGSLYLAIFGIGTIPMMLSVALVGNFMNLKFRKNIQKSFLICSVSWRFYLF